MAEYNPSKIIKDGNTYNFRDTTKIPLAGSNQISGSLIPSTDNSIDIGSSTKNIKMLYTKGINGINPGALSLPCNTYTDDHSNNLVYQDYVSGYNFEASYDCLITLRSQNYNGNYLIVNDTLNIRNSVSSGFSGVNLFARKGDLIGVYCPAASINTGVTLRLFKLKGNE